MCELSEYRLMEFELTSYRREGGAVWNFHIYTVFAIYYSYSILSTIYIIHSTRYYTQYYTILSTYSEKFTIKDYTFYSGIPKSPPVRLLSKNVSLVFPVVVANLVISEIQFRTK